jgi:phage FluMu protein Com
MKIKCRKCGREMDIWEFMPYIEVYLVKLAVTSGLVAIFAEALKSYFFAKQETRGFVDGHMTTFANLLEIKCPQCKKANVWDPISIIEKELTTEIVIEKVKESPAQKTGGV